MNFLQRFFLRKPPPMPPSAWRVFDLNDDESGDSGIIRTLVRRPMQGKAFTSAIEITWRYGDVGLPSKSQNGAMHEFEHAIEELADANANSLLAQVRTGFGEKNWLFYARSKERFMAGLNRRLSGRREFPLQIVFHDDPAWAMWSSADPLNDGGGQGM
jgi:hypothetical protein